MENVVDGCGGDKIVLWRMGGGVITSSLVHCTIESSVGRLVGLWRSAVISIKNDSFICYRNVGGSNPPQRKIQIFFYLFYFLSFFKKALYFTDCYIVGMQGTVVYFIYFSFFILYRISPSKEILKSFIGVFLDEIDHPLRGERS